MPVVQGLRGVVKEEEKVIEVWVMQGVEGEVRKKMKLHGVVIGVKSERRKGWGEVEGEFPKMRSVAGR